MKFAKLTKRNYLKSLAIIAGIILSMVIVDRYIFPLPKDQIFRPSSVFVYSRDRHLMRCSIASDSYWRKPVKLIDISPLLKKSVLACEDRWFYYHPGVNLYSLFSAAIDNIKAGKRVRGGSTITMQIARMMEPKSRTIQSKLIEVLRAIQLESHFSKNELLEIYFNMAPYGGNIEGVGAAAYFYFEKSPKELTASQAALLVSVPNSPTTLRPDINIMKSIRARDKVLGVMLARNIISKDKYNEALAEEIRAKKTEPPLIAPHFTRDLALKYPYKTEIVSTIDLKIQNICDQIIRNARNDLQAKGIYNAAVIVIKNSTAEVLALVGSSNFNDIPHQGQVNGATSPRSPGSALKPFVYAMAMDKGLISPNMVVEDLPVYFSGYSPENYDKQFRGAVSAAEALRLSLNVPAVNLTSQVGYREMIRHLKVGGIKSFNRKESDYGLSLILGACEIKLIELCNLYSSFTRGGIFIPYRSELSAIVPDSAKLFSPATSYIISDILSGLQRPDFPASWEFSPNIPKVAWKTGTSYGRKDAWSIGYDPEYTIGVWVGNFNGEASPNLAGAEVAAPILFEIFNSIGSSFSWFSPPSDVGIRQVCSVSGRPPNDFCQVKIEELFIPGVSPELKCDIHKEIPVDSVSGARLCRYCSSGKRAIGKIYEDWPAKVATWLEKSGHAIASIPEHDPDCNGISADSKPVITSPNNDVVYIIRHHIPLEQQGILLDASVSSKSGKIFWFIDGELIGNVKAGMPLFYLPVTGVHNVTATDSEGKSSSIKINIQ